MTPPLLQQTDVRTLARSLTSAALLIALAVSGCGTKPARLPRAQYLSDSLEVPPPTTADFSRPFLQTMDMLQGEDAGLPVAAAKAFAGSAGGTWVVLAPDALDPVKGLTQTAAQVYNSQPATETISDKIDAIRADGTPITYDTTRGYVYMVFGSQADLTKLRAVPPDPITGLFVRGGDLDSAFGALGDAFHVKIVVDPQLDSFWSTYKQRSTQLQTNIITSQSGSMSDVYAGRFMTGGSGAGTEFNFSNTRRASQADLMSSIATSLGGEAVQSGPAQWKIDSYAPGPALDAQIKSLKSTIDQAAGLTGDTSQDAGAGTSYAERHGEVEGASSSFDITTVATTTSQTVISQLQEELQQGTAVDPSVSSALDQLGVIGPSGLPALVSYLSPSTPSTVSIGVMRVLASQPPGDARSALYQFMNSTIAAPAKAGKELQRLTLISYSITLIDAMSRMDRALDQQAQGFLTTAASADDLPQFMRTQARFVLLRYGILLQSAAAWNPAAELTFKLTPPPASHGTLAPITPSVPNAIRPLATVSLPNGEAWAVFASPRLGNSSDLWLAHAVGGVWREYLFTGKEFQTAQNAVTGDGIQPGGCTISVTGDIVSITPANVHAAAGLADFQSNMQKEQQKDPAKAAKLWAEYNQLQQSAGSSLTVSYTLHLSQLRKDSDGDGLTDQVEQRLGTNPNNRDTMNTGIADGANQNPRVGAPSSSASDRDRQAILQQVFSAMFGADSTPDPIVVVLDKPFQQPFHGASARVLCMTPADYTQSNYTALRCLQFGGPTDQDATILHADGPCMFSDDGRRAEVHFWTVSPTQQMYGRLSMSGSDYVATFHRDGGDWKLLSMDNWHFRTSGAMSSSMLSIQNVIY